jgi:pantoate--beta-alanine ligase
MSSRNLRLNEIQRPQATVFYKALFAAKSMFRDGESISSIKDSVKKIVENEPEVRLEYFEVTDGKNLTVLDNVQKSDKPIMCIAGYVGEIRLIDNMFLD